MTALITMSIAFLMAAIMLAPQNVNSQIPSVCVSDTSLQSLTCCPDECGESEGRGTCKQIERAHENIENVRENWPHYYTHACSCKGNYGGVDCSRCKYGHYGPDCEEFQVLERRSIQNYSDEEWSYYHRVLKMARAHNSGYSVVVGDHLPGTTAANMQVVYNVKLYTLFIWMHHYAAKNNPEVDYAHESTGFLTWHRQFLLWFEWEIQYMLKANGDSDYHMFRLPYWDWRRETLRNESEGIFTYNKLGVTQRQNGQPLVTGMLFDNWNTFCWIVGSGITCNPQSSTGLLLRCPLQAACAPESYNWPTSDDVDTALRISKFDTDGYNSTSNNSFRNFLEGFLPVQSCDNRNLCSSSNNNHIQRYLHNAVHIILGSGRLSLSNVGVMGDVAASPNDPVFINHHAMIDCIFEMWLQKHRRAKYPKNVPAERKGHHRDDFMVPFFPLFTHQDLMRRADNFGYSCMLSGDMVIASSKSLLFFLGLSLWINNCTGQI